MAIGAVLWTGAEDWGDMVGEVRIDPEQCMEPR